MRAYILSIELLRHGRLEQLVESRQRHEELSAIASWRTQHLRSCASQRLETSNRTHTLSVAPTP